MRSFYQCLFFMVMTLSLSCGAPLLRGIGPQVRWTTRVMVVVVVPLEVAVHGRGGSIKEGKRVGVKGSTLLGALMSSCPCDMLSSWTHRGSWKASLLIRL